MMGGGNLNIYILAVSVHPDGNLLIANCDSWLLI